MDIKVRHSEICGEAVAPKSKSAAHRALIASFLAGKLIDDGICNSDVSATFECLNNLKNDATLDVRESGSTLRFLLPVICALGIDAQIVGEGRLNERPLRGLVEVLNLHGARIEFPDTGNFPLNVRGQLVAGEYAIDASISSQYVSGLLFALPILRGDSKLELKGKRVSESYIDLTLATLENYGVEIEKTSYGFYVRGGQKYIAPRDMTIEGDWSSAGFLLALGALCGEVKVRGLRVDSAQGDKVIVDLLRRAGAKMEIDKGIVRAFRADKLCAIDFDASDCPDIVPVMSAVLACAKGPSRISGVDRLKDKESDRIASIMDMLSAFGIRAEYGKGTLTVYGGRPVGGDVNTYGDHRIAMSAAVLAARAEGESLIRGAECVAKSYPSFFDDAKILGLQAEKL